MKNGGNKILLVCILLWSCDIALLDDAETEKQCVTIFRDSMLKEINLVRTNPAVYAETRLKSVMETNTDNGSYLYLKRLTAVGAISFNDSLNKSASEYVMKLKDSLSHCFQGTSLDRALIAGYSGTAIGENIAAATPNSFNAMLNAEGAAIEFMKILIIDEGVKYSGHRLVILNPKYKTAGVGYKRNTSGKYINYVVQIFGNR